MEEIEFIKKINDANNDIKEGQDILRSFNRQKIAETENYIDKCQRNSDYLPYIQVNKLTNNLIGSLSFRQLEFKYQLKVLDCIISSIKQFVAKTTTDKISDNKK